MRVYLTIDTEHGTRFFCRRKEFRRFTRRRWFRATSFSSAKAATAYLQQKADYRLSLSEESRNIRWDCNNDRGVVVIDGEYYTAGYIRADNGELNGRYKITIMPNSDVDLMFAEMKLAQE